MKDKGVSFLGFLFFLGFALFVWFFIATFFNPVKIQGDVRDGQRANDLFIMEKALKIYAMANGEKYPDTNSLWCSPEIGNRYYSNCAGGEYIPGFVTNGYINKLPKDPMPLKNTDNSGYLYASNGTDYKFLIHKTPENCANKDMAKYVDPARPCGSVNASWSIYSSGARDW